MAEELECAILVGVGVELGGPRVGSVSFCGECGDGGGLGLGCGR